jgi:hypothetical protein
MAREVLLGLVAGGGDAESAVNNFVEEGFAEGSISVVMRSEAEARAIIADGGPLRGLTAANLAGMLAGLGLSSNEVAGYTGAVQQGRALIAISVDAPDAAAAVETLRDYHALQVRTVAGKGEQ